MLPPQFKSGRPVKNHWPKGIKSAAAFFPNSEWFTHSLASTHPQEKHFKRWKHQRRSVEVGPPFPVNPVTYPLWLLTRDSHHRTYGCVLKYTGCPPPPLPQCWFSFSHPFETTSKWASQNKEPHHIEVHILVGVASLCFVTMVLFKDRPLMAPNQL